MKKAACWILTAMIAICMLSGCWPANADDNELVTVYCVQNAQYHKINGDKFTSTTCTYYDTGFLKSRMRNSDVTDSFTYDDRGNILSGPNGRTGNSTFVYDDNNNVLTETWTLHGNEEKIVNTYNKRNQLVKTEHLSNGQVQILETYKYDIFGNKVSATYEYLTNKTEPNQYLYWKYDLFGNMLSQKIYYGDTLRHEITCTYYLNGKLASKKELLDGERIFEQTCTYDLLGNLVLNYTESLWAFVPEASATELLPCTERNEYDLRGNLLKQTIITEGSKYSYSWTYNARGQKTSYTTENTKTEWEYDEHGNLVTYRWYYDGELSQTIQYSYRSFEVPRWAAKIIEKQQSKYLDVPNKWA